MSTRVRWTVDDILGNLLAVLKDGLVACFEGKGPLEIHLGGPRGTYDLDTVHKIMRDQEYEIYDHAFFRLLGVCDPIRPLKGNTCVEALSQKYSASSGTIGFSATSRSGPKGFVTAAHVANSGCGLYQPDSSPANYVGNTMQVSDDGYIDAAFVGATSQVTCEPELFLAGKVCGTIDYGTIRRRVHSDEVPIRWAGRGSGGLVDGKIFSVGYVAGKREQFRIDPPAQPGDSGASIAIQNEENAGWDVAGILWAMGDATGVDPYGIACNYERISTTLGIDIDIAP